MAHAGCPVTTTTNNNNSCGGLSSQARADYLLVHTSAVGYHPSEIIFQILGIIFRMHLCSEIIFQMTILRQKKSQKNTRAMHCYYYPATTQNAGPRKVTESNSSTL